MKRAQLIKVGNHMASLIMVRMNDNFNYDEILETISSYQKISNDVQYGEYLIYYDQCREFLKDLYDETDDEADKYTDAQVWEQYKHCLAIMSNHKKYIIDPLIDTEIARHREEIAALNKKRDI